MAKYLSTADKINLNLTYLLGLIWLLQVINTLWMSTRFLWANLWWIVNLLYYTGRVSANMLFFVGVYGLLQIGIVVLARIDMIRFGFFHAIPLQLIVSDVLELLSFIVICIIFGYNWNKDNITSVKTTYMTIRNEEEQQR
eukprot:GAHX01000428.1.p1 GENE.GAHX01000428.1~~GAHX01000428.1.p1  ORF type:complete len:156 (-),score=10.01 GAHX01000428.1:118-537(-)